MAAEEFLPVKYDKVMQEETTYGEFKSHAKDYLKQLITKPSTAKLDDFLASRLKEKGISQGQFLNKLIDNGIVIKKAKVDDGLGEEGTGKPSYSIQYKIPNERFEHKLKKLHISLFEQNLPEGVITEEGGGATACAFDGAGQFIQPLNGGKDESGSGIIRRKIYLTREQLDEIVKGTLDEATAGDVGDYDYDAPIAVKKGDPTLVHQKGKKHGTAANAIGMDRMNEEGGYDMSTPEGRAGAEKWMRYIMSQSDPSEEAAKQWAYENGFDGDENIISAFKAGVEYGRQY